MIEEKTELQKWKAEFRQKFRTVFVVSVLTAIIAPFVGFAVAVVGGYGDELAALRRAPAQIEDLIELVERNSTLIQRLRIPTEIFKLEEESGPVEGFCVEEQNCRYKLRIRRFENALSCRLVESGFEYYYLNPRDNEQHFSERVAGRPRNVGTRPVNLDFTFTTPSGIAPDAQFCVKASYVGCPGMNEGDDAVPQEPQCVSVEVR